MKKSIIYCLLLFAAWACTQQKEITKSQTETKSITIDSTEYEITILDPAFDRWFMMRYSPVSDRNNEYYRMMNERGISNWNQYFTRGRYSDAISTYINYNPAVDYGIEVNRRLYYYFMYIEESFRVPLLR